MNHLPLIFANVTFLPDSVAVAVSPSILTLSTFPDGIGR
jgi:hypothetical protein